MPGVAFVGWRRAAFLAALALPGSVVTAPAQAPAVTDTSSHHGAEAPAHSHGTHGVDMSGMSMGAMAMSGMYGPYPMSREASGTSWQPQAARHEGAEVMRGAWMLMFHGFADVVYDRQGGGRG